MGAVAALGRVGTAGATPVSITNASFETPALANPNGQQTDDFAPGWQGNSVISNAWGVRSEPHGAVLGPQYGYINFGYLYQDTGPLQPNTTYTLTTSIGNRDTDSPASGSMLMLNGTDDSGTVLASLAVVGASSTAFTLYTLTYTTGAVVSGDLTVDYRKNSPGPQLAVDGVQLDAGSLAAVPLPQGVWAGSLLAGVLVLWLKAPRRLSTAVREW